MVEWERDCEVFCSVSHPAHTMLLSEPVLLFRSVLRMLVFPLVLLVLLAFLAVVVLPLVLLAVRTLVVLPLMFLAFFAVVVLPHVSHAVLHISHAEASVPGLMHHVSVHSSHSDGSSASQKRTDQQDRHQSACHLFQLLPRAFRARSVLLLAETVLDPYVKLISLF